MKKGLVFAIILISCIIAVSAVRVISISDDSDVSEPNTLWNRFVDWLKSAGQAQPDVIISSNAVKNIIPGSDEAVSHIERVRSRTDHIVAETDDCSVTICLSNTFKEVYCPLDYSECCSKYNDCKIIECATDDDVCVDEDVYNYEVSYEEDTCYEEYNNCFDDGVAVICKGPFEDCDDSFDRCSCGTGDGVDDYGEQAEPDFNTEDPIDCATGVFVCDRQVITMSGDLAESTVTCKESFQRCSQTYGNCQCGDSSLTDFPVQYTGTDDDNNEYIAPANYECSFEGKNVPCNMMPGDDCNEKVNSCNRGDGIWISCSGAFSYCNNTFDGHCLCGVENLGYGDMVTNAD